MTDPVNSLVHHLGFAAQQVGCCGASCKENCRRPPCPCNLDAWSPQELRQIHDCERREADERQKAVLRANGLGRLTK